MKKISLIITLLFVLTTVSFAKQEKLAKGITFDGEVVNKEPTGFGILTFTEQDYSKTIFLTIQGNFDGEKISKGTLKYDNRNSDIWNDDTYLFNMLEGEFTISHDKKWEFIEIGAPSVKVEGSEVLNLKTIRIENKQGKGHFKIIEGSEGKTYSTIPKIANPSGISLLGYNAKECLTECEFKFGNWTSSPHILSIISLGIIKFPDGATLKKESFLNVFNSPSGDYMVTEDFERSDRPAFLIEFTIHDKENNVYKLKRSNCSFYNKQPEISIIYSDGSKYEGSVLLESSLKRSNCENFGLDYYQKIKAFTKKSLNYYTGIYTDSSGNTTEYKKGLSEAQIQANKRAEEEKEEIARQKKEEQRRIKHNELVKKYGEKYATAIERNKILVGMTREMMKQTKLFWSIHYEDKNCTVYKGSFSFAPKDIYVYVTLEKGKVTEVLYK